MTTVEESLGILEEKFRAIADAIRERRGYTRKLTLADMPPEIRAIGESDTHWRFFHIGGGHVPEEGKEYYSVLNLTDVYGTKDYAKWFCFRLQDASGYAQPSRDNGECLVAVIGYDPNSFSAICATRKEEGNKITTKINIRRPSCTVIHEAGSSKWEFLLNFGVDIVTTDHWSWWRSYATVDAGY